MIRDDLTRNPEIMEKKMVGGLYFMYRGHMLCGVHKSKDTAMFRVGPDNDEASLEIREFRELTFSNRPMKGKAF